MTLNAGLGERIRTWADLLALRDQAVHVVGAGAVEGAHLCLFFIDHGFTRLVGHDFASPAEFDRSFSRFHVAWPKAEREAMLARVKAGVELRLGEHYLEGIDSAAAIAVGPGWDLYPANRPLHAPALRERSFSLIQLYLALAPGPVVGVSGSQGKSTTSQLLGDMLEAAQVAVAYGGNYRHGRQCLDRLEHAGPETHLLLEISNRHLKMLHRSPNVSVVTNVYPNHLDEHGGWDGYVEAKSRMVHFQHDGDTAVLNADLDVTRAMAGLGGGDKLWFGNQLAAGELGVLVTADAIEAVGLGPFHLPGAEVKVPGQHNLMNVAAATTAALALGVQAPALEAAVAKFRGLKHRIQFIWDAGGVRYYDDLNSTTPTATEAALRTIDRPLAWILGGDDKGLDARVLAAQARERVRLALALPGPGTEGIVAELEREGVAVERVGDLPEAVARGGGGRPRRGCPAVARLPGFLHPLLRGGGRGHRLQEAGAGGDPAYFSSCS